METRMLASSTSNDPVVIVGAARTALGGFQGDFASLTAPQLGASAIRAAFDRAGLQPEGVDEILMGCVLPAGLGQAPARQAALSAGLPLSAGCTTINKVCGSGMKATMLAAMDCFHLLGLVVILRLPLAFLIRHFQIGSTEDA